MGQSAHPVLLARGTVHALDGRTPRADSILLEGGRVRAVGEESALAGVAPEGTERIDLDGATVIPGLVDTHPHLLHFGAFEAPLVRVFDAKSHAEIVERVRSRAAETPNGDWILVSPVGEPHYFLRRSWRDLEEGVLPDRRVLDTATSAHPVFLQAWAPVTPNVCTMNSAALAKLGLSRETPDRVANVWIEKDERGEPTGRLHGSVNNYYSGDDFMNALLRQIPLLQPERVLDGAREAMRRYNAMGVTTVYEGHTMGRLEVGAWQALREAGAQSVRVLTALEAEQYGLPWSRPQGDAGFEAHLEHARASEQTEDDWLRHRGITIGRGGPCWPGFLRMREPYLGPYGEKTQGRAFVSRERQQRAIAYCAEHGVRLNAVNAGQLDHDEFLDDAEAEVVRTGRADAARGWILQHVFFLSEPQARRYAALGLDVTTSISFSWGKGDLFAERIGEHVLPDLIPLRRMLDEGLVVACGSDWGPKNLFEQIALAETHRFALSGRENAGPAQRVSREQALAMWTRDAARVLQWDGIGTLAPGSHADLAVLDRDPLTCPNEALAGTRVLRCFVAGRDRLLRA